MSDIKQSLRQQKEEAIIQSAIKNFMRNGFHRVSADLIIKNSGISKMAFYKYFGSKENLIKICLNIKIEEQKNNLDKILILNNCKLKKLFEWYLSYEKNFKLNGCLIQNASIELWYLNEIQESIKAFNDYKFMILKRILDELHVEEFLYNVLYNFFNGMIVSDKFSVTYEDIEKLINSNYKLEE